MYSGSIILFIAQAFIVSSKIQETCKQKLVEVKLEHENCISKIVEVGYCTGCCLSRTSFVAELKSYSRRCTPVSGRVKLKTQPLECFGNNTASTNVSKEYQHIEECRCQDV